MSIRLYWFYLIHKGKKKIEVRKNKPKDKNFNGIVWLYISKTNWKKDLAKIPFKERAFYESLVGKVVAKFKLNEVCSVECVQHSYYCDESWYQLFTTRKDLVIQDTMLDEADLECYLDGDDGYGWVVDDLEIFDKPKELNEFKTKLHIKGGCKNCPQNTGFSMPYCKTCDFLLPLTRAPQSWCYIEI